MQIMSLKTYLLTSVGKFPGNAVPIPTPKFEFFWGFVPENPQIFFVVCPHLVPEVLLEVELIPVPKVEGHLNPGHLNTDI